MTELGGLKILSERLPIGFENLLNKWLEMHPVQIRLSRPRQTKLGDFRPSHDKLPPRISINADLHPVEFLLTLTHEIAHNENWLLNGRRVKPHGREWKTIYRTKLKEIIDSGFLEERFEKAILYCFFGSEKLATSSCPMLRRLFDEENKGSDVVRLADIPEGSIFSTTNMRTFIKGKKRRTRYSCREVKSRRIYTVHPMAEIVEFRPPKL